MTGIKAVSVLQPWATLILLGVKCFETRAWRTAHRGALAIHAGRRLTPAGRALAAAEPIATLLRDAGYRTPDCLPRGVVLGEVELVACTPVEELDPDLLSDVERALGDFGPGRWAWELRRPHTWPIPIPAVGRLGVFTLPASVCP
jgi:hypothetical protein